MKMVKFYNLSVTLCYCAVSACVAFSCCVKGTAASCAADSCLVVSVDADAAKHCDVFKCNTSNTPSPSAPVSFSYITAAVLTDAEVVCLCCC